ncbi:MAG: tRNA (guanine-N7)-methyltransferase [Deltaproteobacteria bacterium]|nr:tRNA (guanine-N7)-methyltransferase [Deltaproteobacteria bacterium]
MRDHRAEYAKAPRLPEGDAIDLADVMPASGPLELEIGPGRGMFILERAAAAPEARLLGLEIKRKWSTIVDGRLRAKGYGDRARVLCEDAKLALPRLRPDASVTRCFVHFPDPWWKARHAKRMVLGDELVAELVRLLVDDGELYVQTDVLERAERYEGLLVHPLLAPFGDEPESPVLDANPYGARSNREKRADEDGLPVTRLRYRRLPRTP